MNSATLAQRAGTPAGILALPFCSKARWCSVHTCSFFPCAKSEELLLPLSPVLLAGCSGGGFPVGTPAARRIGNAAASTSCPIFTLSLPAASSVSASSDSSAMRSSATTMAACCLGCPSAKSPVSVLTRARTFRSWSRSRSFAFLFSLAASACCSLLTSAAAAAAWPGRARSAASRAERPAASFFERSFSCFSASRLALTRGSCVYASSTSLLMRAVSTFFRATRAFSFSRSIHRRSSRKSASATSCSSSWQKTRQERKSNQKL
mmetsp:Transcript_12295/g.31015  ORF Transcript_12295/g.31015 Transcript_12295/m.31015 type:complete len:264 (-) Transcript_12295:658-1449(-)